ncbi:hypothetical protein GCM10023187_34050 [Nibrella viscosa]|uniref:Uncharacterized protein n=1 Tax=Nibrella viscosa TaxID=1084524 RepID=A0ABP8KMT9_9BACT
MLSFLFKKASSRPPWFVSNFDSATGLVKALANSLHGEGFPGAGSLPEREWLAQAINLLPWPVQQRLYIMGSAKGAVAPEQLASVQAEAFAEWVVSLYPKKTYPAIFIGSSNGAAMHLAAAMGVPWLPQTFLIPVKTPNLSPDDPKGRIAWATPFAQQLLDHNPALQLHHMMDPLQDRPMIPHTSYFRVKLRSLGPAYASFIRDHLAEGGTVFLIDCQKRWPVTQVGDRHYFQFGGLGGLRPEEYQQGSELVTEFLRDAGADVAKWDAPVPDCEQPESEWGFVASLGEEVSQLAETAGYRVSRLVFDEPEELSPHVADLYRWWYRQRGMPARTLLAEMFFLVEPYWALRTGAVPFWIAFNAQPSAERLRHYLQQTEPFDNIFLLPFSNGVAGPGLATEKELNAILDAARQRSGFLGASPGRYPFDFGIYARYEKDLKEKMPVRYSITPRLTTTDVAAFTRQTMTDRPIGSIWIG